MAIQWTEEERDALREAIATGALVVKYEDQTVTYRSLSEMRALLREMEESITGKPSGVRVRYPRTSTGL